MNQSEELTLALAPVAAVLNQLMVRFYVGGSVASSFHGAIRSTMDVDIVCDLQAGHLEAMRRIFEQEYYIRESAMVQAVQNRSSFNLIHLTTSFKIDVFVSRGRRFDRDCFDRCQVESLFGRLPVPIATPEDSIVAKLEWFRAGDEISQRQWDDVSKLINLHSGAVEVLYLKKGCGVRRSRRPAGASGL